MSDDATSVGGGATSPGGGGVSTSGAVLSVRDLRVAFATPEGDVPAVSGVSFDLRPGEVLALVGESGSGKTTTALALLGLLPRAGRVVAGSASLDESDLLTLPPAELRAVRGRQVAMIFQDPFTALNPVHTAGAQIAEALTTHQPGLGRAAVAARVRELMGLVGIPDAERRARQYPHQLSGGMRQRVLLAMALANEPRVLIADEPTSALDATVQAQILDVLRDVRLRARSSILLITHDLGVVAELADRVAVMYAGRIVETADVTTFFAQPRHPYSLGLLDSRPQASLAGTRLPAVPGQPPSLRDVPPGCAFHPRCALRRGREACGDSVPVLRATDLPGGLAACHFMEEMPSHVQDVREHGPLTAGGEPPR